MLISLDVSSLYTNVPTNLAIAVIDKKWETLEEHTPIHKDDFKDMVQLCLDTTYFSYSNKLYRQVFGTAMGSPISSVIADLVMEDLEETAIRTLPFKLPFYKRYVDDIFTAVPKNMVQFVQERFNAYHPRLQFTVETEDSSHSLSFLDVSVTHSDTFITTNWFRKPTWSGRYLNHNSHHPQNQKNSVIYGLCDRAILLSNPEHRKENLKLLRNTLTRNGYPIEYVQELIAKRVYALYNKRGVKDPNNNTDDDASLVPEPRPNISVVPYVKGLSEKIQKSLRKYNISVCSKSQNNLGHLFTKLKDDTPTLSQSDVVYSIPCIQCDGVYIGQTKQHLKNRIRDHKNNVFKKPNEYTALTLHKTELDHNFDYDNVSILDREHRYKNRLMLEMVRITENKNSVNLRTDVRNLAKVYHPLIKSARGSKP